MFRKLLNLLTKNKDQNIVEFGRYPQTRSGEIKPIRWIVLSKFDDTVLLLSEKILDKMSYNCVAGPVTWETCSLRNWLNSEFFLTAFSQEDKQRIVWIENNNHNNFWYYTPGGNNTRDRVFLLSTHEVGQYWGYGKKDEYGNDSRQAFATDYCNLQESSSDNSSDWWLRSPGFRSDFAQYVGRSGTHCENNSIFSHMDLKGVRPAICIKVCNTDTTQ